MPPENFGGLSEEDSQYEKARAVIFPVPLERTTTYEHGTRNGPAAILAASRNMELYDEELDTRNLQGDRHRDRAGDRHDGRHARRSAHRNFYRAVRTARRREISRGAGRRTFADAAAGAGRARKKYNESQRAADRRARRFARRISGKSRQPRLRDAPRAGNLPGGAGGNSFAFGGGGEGDSEAEDENLLGEGYRARAAGRMDREGAGRSEPATFT